MLQATGEIDEKLRRIQWIDFRNGMHNLPKLAQLLPDPEKLLKALAVPPTGSQEVFPWVINILQYFYVITGILGAGGILVSMLSYVKSISNGPFSIIDIGAVEIWIILGSLAYVSILYSLRGLRSRKGGTAAIYPLLFLTFLQVILYLSYVLASFTSPTKETEMRQTGVWNQQLMETFSYAAIGSAIALFAILVGLGIIVPFLFFRWSEFRRWLPRRQQGAVGKVESALMLYTPLRKAGLVFNVIFHSILVFGLPGMILSMFIDVRMMVLFLPFDLILGFIILAPIRWLGRRMSK